MTATASRFAVLRIENDEDEKAAQRLRDKQKAVAQKGLGGKGRLDEAAKVAQKNALKKQKAAQEKAELKALAFGGNVTKTAAKKKQHVKAQVTLPEEWQLRDQDFVDVSYERQLEEALLASKIDYEENKIIQKVHKEEQPAAKEPAGVNAKKPVGNKKGIITMSLDEFNQAPQAAACTKDDKLQNAAAKARKAPEEQDDFFQHVTQEAKAMAKKECVNKITMNKKLPINTQPKEVPVNEVPRLAQLQEDLRQKTEEAENLLQENETLREKLSDAKSRNKRLCHILAQGEMKEKAELIVQIEKLNKIRDELTAEVENLAGLLQQERSKVSALTDAKKTLGQKK